MNGWVDRRPSGRQSPGGFKILLALMVLSLAGCLVQRREPLPPAPLASTLQQATLDELLTNIRSLQEAIQILDATVEIAPSVRSAQKAEIVHYRDVRAFLLVRKPAFLRMIGQYPVVRNTAFDLASDGEHFGLYIPSKNRFITGDSRGGRRRESALENLRPQHILDALLWKGPEPDREEAALEVVTEGQKSYYVVHVLRRLEAGHLLLARKLWIERAGLTLERLQIFDERGEVATDARYSDYDEFSEISYPRQIVMDRPKDDYGLVLTISQLRFNQPLGDDKFELERPAGAELINLEAPAASEEGPNVG